MPNKLAKLTVVILTRPNIQNIQGIFKSLDIQTFQDFKVILLIDSVLTKKEFDDLKKDAIAGLKNISNKIQFISNINTDFVPQSGVSYVRNFGIKLAKTKFINLFDDDELLDKDYLQKSFDIRDQKREELQKDFVLVPTLMFRKTGQIQSQGFDYYNFWTSRPHALWLKKDQQFGEVQMFSGNSLFGPTKVFQEILFDESFDFVYEDLEFTYRLYKSGCPIIVARDLLVYHMERDKNILEHARVGSKFAAYRKAKHRIMFIRKNGSTLDKIKFYLLGFRAQPLRLTLKIIRYGKKREVFPLIFSLIRGTWDGLVFRIKYQK